MAGIPPNYQQQNHGPAYSMGYGAQQPEKNKERNRGMLTGWYVVSLVRLWFAGINGN